MIFSRYRSCTDLLDRKELLALLLQAISVSLRGAAHDDTSVASDLMPDPREIDGRLFAGETGA
jgi:hypothetical protein